MPKLKVAVTLERHLLVRTLATERIGRRIARASAGDLAHVVEGLNEIIGA